MKFFPPWTLEFMKENTLDLLSNLPDEILCRIIAFLPSESALETIFLSTRWRGLWNTSLVRHGTIEAAANAISGFLTHFDELDPLRQPRKLQYHFGKDSTLLATIADFRQGPGNIGFKSCDFDPTLLTIKNAEILTLCKWTFEALIWPSISYFQSNFQFYKLKKLWWIDNSTEGYNSEALISFLKLCPALEQLFVTIDPKSYCMPSTATYSKKVTRHSELGHLKVVKLEGFTNKEDEISLAENFTKLGAVEPLIIATTDGICLRSLVKAPLYQPKQQCRSNLERVAPWSHDRKYTYKFVEVIGDINEDCRLLLIWRDCQSRILLPIISLDNSRQHLFLPSPKTSKAMA
ncbi:F-box protein At2g39490 isoform X3 [Alnus glutinosa]|uniref:F-box protein At2g39490 isoform X3 n=1 Tax=Alnus glutinosa TaxID=3517 RepID=UPI002D767A47|nr:F-box protein At2g39490 isoform X3 [Alnus glutinosa]